jgi:bifunctional non-homologous end joining protein LigD
MTSKCKHRFVLHEHYASHHHFDFRLERYGTLKSWALPKGLPTTIGEKHLAVQVPNHPISYINFRGIIPKGEYGAGTVSIADSGCYESLLWTAKKIEIILEGQKYYGKYILIPFSDKNEWMIMKVRMR